VADLSMYNIIITLLICCVEYCVQLILILSIGMCRTQRFLAVLRSFFHSSSLYSLSFYPFPPTSLPFSLTLSCHLFLGLPINLVVPKFIYNTLLVMLFPSILCSCPNQLNLLKLTVSLIVGFLIISNVSLLVNILQFSFSLSLMGLTFFYSLSSQKRLFAFNLVSLVSSFRMHMLNFCLLLYS